MLMSSDSSCSFLPHLIRHLELAAIRSDDATDEILWHLTSCRCPRARQPQPSSLVIEIARLCGKSDRLPPHSPPSLSASPRPRPLSRPPSFLLLFFSDP